MTGIQLAFKKTHIDERRVRTGARFAAVSMGFYVRRPIMSANNAGGAFMKFFSLIILVAVIGVAAVFLPQNSWAGGVSVGIGIGIPAPVAVYPVPTYYPTPYGYSPPVVYGPAIVFPGGPYYRYYGGPYYRYYGRPYYRYYGFRHYDRYRRHHHGR